MTVNRLADDLDPMRQAIADAQSFTEGMAQADFEQDRRTQQAVVMSLIVLGEAATKVMDQHSAFAAEHSHILGAACAACATALPMAILRSTSKWFGTRFKPPCRF